jgi:hypothetical protein
MNIVSAEFNQPSTVICCVDLLLQNVCHLGPLWGKVWTIVVHLFVPINAFCVILFGYLTFIREGLVAPFV